MPLVIITTNEERVLPDAFVRRCLVLHLSLPKDKDELKELLLNRGRAHFSEAKISDELMAEAADMLIEDRLSAIAEQISPLPGQAEFIDLLQALEAVGDDEKQKTAMSKLREFVFQKHTGLEG